MTNSTSATTAVATDSGRPVQAAASSFSIDCSRNFPGWLAEQRISLGFTTYQAGKLFFVGTQPSGRIGVFERTFNRAMGLCGDGQTLWLSTAYQLWRFENVLEPGATDGEFDRLYVPRGCHVTGDIDVHDIALGSDGRPVFVSTLFGCLATVSDRYSFEPIWQPKWLSKLAAEDRCHLNGMALEDGRPKYVTACSQSDIVDGWRDQRTGGGCVVDVASHEVIATGFSMPHSPRLYRGKLWLLDSGRGQFGHVDRATGKFESVAFLPGYPRGLTFVGDYAVIGVSKPRHEKTFTGLPLDEELSRRNASAQCGLFVIDLRSGDTVHWLRAEGAIAELYDVLVLPGVRRPKALGFQTDEIRHNV
ncbi:MAG: TIGR03032 family protein, partial [Candidatus Saccharimonas sp.]|nr:TIGR03032 family protein [Planctomycetaceae bacterium]